MADQTNYKRTVAGSVGAGMGALFNASGRTYYILEHKTNSQYHSAGESQKIIIDQIEMGRDSSCQVRFDESFETVSRKHAAIVRDGQNWQLVHLSNSNPTLVNGRPIEGTYYLQSGDEIQLSVGGPRMGFIVPQGKQALTSSIKLTERMNLFRQQALAPYRRAIWTLATLLLLTIIGFGIWTYMLHRELATQKAEAIALQEQAYALTSQIEELEKVADKTPEMEQQLAALKTQRANVVTSYRTIVKEVEKKDDTFKGDLMIMNQYVDSDSKNDDVVEASTNNSADDSEDMTKQDVREYYPSIYRIVIDNIKLERNGESRDAGLATEKLDCGTGFITSNGTFLTARQNIQPWINVNGIAPTGWRQQLAKWVSMGFDVVMQFSAYSTLGPSQKLTFSSRDFDLPESGDIISATVTIEKSDWIVIQNLGFAITKQDLKMTGSDFRVTTSSNRAYALYHATGRTGIPSDNGAAQSLAGGHEILICGYTSNNVHNLSGAANYHTTNTQAADTKAGTIRIQNAPGSLGFLGAPAFIRESNGSLQVVGVYVGQSQIIPIGNCR